MILPDICYFFKVNRHIWIKIKQPTHSCRRKWME